MSGLNDIRFVKGQGGLGATLPNEDHKSGIVFLRSYAAGGSAPATPFTTEKITSLKDAIAKGITEAAYPEEYYTIMEFFRIQPDSTLYVHFGAAEDAGYDFSELTTLQRFADGDLRQIVVMTYSAFELTNVPILQAISDSLSAEHKPLSILYAGDLTAMTLSNLADLRDQTSPNVSVIIAMDGNNKGKTLFDAGKIVPAIGAALGALSVAAVNESIAHVEHFKMSADELDVPAFANGQLVKDTDPNLLNELNDKGYVFLRKHVGIAGSYWNENSTCDAITSDYAYINNVRTIDKAVRGVRTYLLPKLNSNVELTPDGKLSLETIVDWQNVAGKSLEQMVKNGEISAFKVEINPDQDIMGTSLLIVNITLVINGIARNIEVQIGYGTV